MYYTVTRDECPYCKETSEIHNLVSNPYDDEATQLTISRCDSCCGVWETRPDGEGGRLFYPLYPVCWEELKADYEKWILKRKENAGIIRMD